MHPRNIYKDNPPDFKELAIKYPYFRSYSRENTSGAVTIDFKDPKALRALTYALLENDFDIKIEIPLDRLIPTLPLRLNYILWVEDLVGCLPGYDTHSSVIGVDIGK
jgi:methyltransferase